MRNFSVDRGVIWRIIRIGIPASVMGMERTFGNLILIRLMASFGTLGVAGHTLNQRIDMFVMVPAMGLGQAAGVLAGQNLGAKQPGRAAKTGWLGAGLLSMMMVVISAAILLWAEYVVRIFNSSPELVELASGFIRIAAIGYLLTGLTAALQQCVSGAGDTVPPMLITLLNLWAVQVPLAFVLSKYTSLEVFGVRWAMVAGMATASIAYVIYFRLGRWKHKQV